MAITRRALGRTVAAAGLPLLQASAQRNSASAPARRPNVIVVLLDDVGYGDFSWSGNPHIKTPAADRLRRESVLFSDFHVAPMCTPTRAQLMTGRNCLNTRAMNVSSGRTLLRRDFPTMADVFAAGGYRTGIFGKWHLGDSYPYRPEDRGFQEAVWYPSSHIGSAADAWNNDYFNDRYRHNGRLEQYEGYCTDVFFNEAMRWMRAPGAGGGQPFFAYLPLNAAHGPLFVPKEFAEPYRHLPNNVARFYGMIAHIDHSLERLETMLRESGLRENTVLLFFSDNGGTAGVRQFNAGLRGQKITLYEGGHRVPLLLRWPGGGIQTEREIGELTHVQDVLPTLADLCGLQAPAGLDGVSLGPLLRAERKELPDRTLIVQFSRMNVGRPKKDDAAVMWKNWRLIGGNELYDVAADRAQEKNLFEARADVAARMQNAYDRWWQGVEPLLDSFLPVHVGSPRENPLMLSACDWADVFLDQGAQVRRGEPKSGRWHLYVEQFGQYEITLRRWPRDVDVALDAAVPEHRGEDGVYPAGVALPIAQARLRIGSGFDQTVRLEPGAREAVFRLPLDRGPLTMQSWFLDANGKELAGAYFAYVERKSGAAKPVKIIFDTDIMGDVDDVGAIAMLHTLIGRGEAEVLAMGVCARHPYSVACLDALNHHYGRSSIPIGANKQQGWARESKYVEQIAKGWTHRWTQSNAPDTVELYRQVLAGQPDHSVVLVSVGQLSTVARLIESDEGMDLARRKIRAWVCMGGQFPKGREANIRNHAWAARQAIARWPGAVIFSGWEIGNDILTGGAMRSLPANHPARRSYELFNGIQPHKSWDQTAVLYAVRCLEDDREGWWSLSRPGVCEVDPDGVTTWREDPNGRHVYLAPRRPVGEVAKEIEGLMLGG